MERIIQSSIIESHGMQVEKIEVKPKRKSSGKKGGTSLKTERTVVVSHADTEISFELPSESEEKIMKPEADSNG